MSMNLHFVCLKLATTRMSDTILFRKQGFHTRTQILITYGAGLNNLTIIALKR